MPLPIVESQSSSPSSPRPSKRYVSRLLARPSSSLSPILSPLGGASLHPPSHHPRCPLPRNASLTPSMNPFQPPQRPTRDHHYARPAQQDQDMSPGSGRKKPVCQKCGHPMAGHKRPYGAPICPRDETAPAPSPSPTPTLESTLPVAGPSKSSRKKGLSPEFVFEPSASGYWHRANPNWVDPDQMSKPIAPVGTPQRGDSWVSTERDSSSATSPPRRRGLPNPGVIHIDVDVDVHERERSRYSGSQMDEGEDEHEHGEFHGGDGEEFSDTQSISSASSDATILKRMTRGLSRAIGRSTPLASLYSSPRDELNTITSAAQAEGLYTRVVHHHRPITGVKDEPVTPTRTTPTREHSWWVAVGRDRGAVDALVQSRTPGSARAESVDVVPEDGPYDFDRGLDTTRNERVGTYPVDPRTIRSTFFDTLLAGAVGGLVMFYCLSTV